MTKHTNTPSNALYRVGALGSAIFSLTLGYAGEAQASDFATAYTGIFTIACEDRPGGDSTGVDNDCDDNVFRAGARC